MSTLFHRILFTFALTISYTCHAQDVVPIGAILPLTGDGVFWGENPKHGIELAIEDLKLDSSNRSVRFIFEDDRCSAKDAVAAFHKLVNVDGVKVILGPSCSSAAAAVAPLAEKYGVLLLAFAESDEVKTGPHVRRLWVPNSLQGRRLAQYAYDSHMRSISVLSTQNAFGSTMTAAFAQEFTKLGGKILATKDSADGLALADLVDSSAAEFKVRWELKFRSKYPGIQSGASLFYDIALVVGRYVRDNDPRSVGEYLRTLDYAGVSGNIKFTSAGNLDRQHMIYRVRQGGLELLSDESASSVIPSSIRRRASPKFRDVSAHPSRSHRAFCRRGLVSGVCYRRSLCD